jgi:hypothetical protein
MERDDEGRSGKDNYHADEKQVDELVENESTIECGLK